MYYLITICPYVRGNFSLHISSHIATIKRFHQVKEVNLLDTYMDPSKQESYSSTTALYNEQRQRMDAIRQTALALR